MSELSNAAVLNECRDLVTKRMRSSITKIMNELDDILLARTFDKKYRIEEGIGYDTIREIHLKKNEIKTRFEVRYVSLFRESIERAGTGLGSAELRTRLASDSIKNDDVGKTIEKINTDCRSELLSLDKKIGALLSKSSQERVPNPVKPEFICAVFEDACSDISTGEEVRTLLLNIFDKHATKELQNIYMELNGLLARRIPATDIELENDERKIERDAIMVRYRIMSILEQRLQGHEVPEFVRSFLFKHWCSFLEKVYLGQGDSNPIWDKAIETTDNLIFSVKRVPTDEGRKKLNWLLPSLIFRLRNGMRIASVPVLEKTKFLNRLKSYHLEVLSEKAEETGETKEDSKEANLLLNPEETKGGALSNRH